MGERLLCKQEVIGSIPFTSTTRLARGLLAISYWLLRSGRHEFACNAPALAGGFFDRVKRECDRGEASRHGKELTANGQ